MATYLEAISDGLREAMRADRRVFVLGEDIGAFGGAFKVTEGLLEEFGAERVRDTPIAEAGIIGTAVGAAIMGLRPVCEMQFADFVACGFDQLVNVAAKMHYRLGLAVPLVVRLPSGGGFAGGPFHSQNPEAWFMHAPGLKVFAPATPRDAKGMLVTAISDPNPVVFLEHKDLYRRLEEELPEGEVRTPATARIARQGTDLTLIAYGAMVHTALAASADLDGASVEVVDVRSLVPLDAEAILASVRKTSRAIVVDEANSTCAAGAEIAALIGERAFEFLDGPVRRVATPDVPIPFSPPLEQAVLPSVERIAGACREPPSPTETLVDVVMPQLGTSMAEGTVIGWLHEVGGEVVAEQPICEISTDKIDSDCPAPVSGIVAEVLVPAGETVAVGTVLARIRAAGEGPRRYSPLVRRIAAAESVDLSLVSGSGHGGRVTKQDLLGWIEADRGAREEAVEERVERPLHGESPFRPEPQSGPAAAGGGSERLSRMRQSIGEAMVRSQRTAATCHTVIECDMEAVERHRRELGLTALPLVARAAIETLAEFPDLNSTLDGTAVTRFAEVHLGIAVSLGADGLIVPVVRDAHELSERGLAARIRDLARRAREGTLVPDEVGGATFTISNPGRYGATIATPVIDLPQVGILDVEAVVRRVVVLAGQDGSEAIGIRPICNLILGWDHRAIDGIYAAQFLAALRDRLAPPPGAGGSFANPS